MVVLGKSAVSYERGTPVLQPRTIRLESNEEEELLSSEHDTYKKVNARFWSWLSGNSPYNHSRCSLSARKRNDEEEPLSREEGTPKMV